LTYAGLQPFGVHEKRHGVEQILFGQYLAKRAFEGFTDMKSVKTNHAPATCLTTPIRRATIKTESRRLLVHALPGYVDSNCVKRESTGSPFAGSGQQHRSHRLLF